MLKEKEKKRKRWWVGLPSVDSTEASMTEHLPDEYIYAAQGLVSQANLAGHLKHNEGM